MAKKKTKSAPKSTPKKTKSHGQLFDSHPNLIWLLPIFLIIAAVAVIMWKNSLNPVTSNNMLQADQIPSEINSVASPSSDAMEDSSGL